LEREVARAPDIEGTDHVVPIPANFRLDSGEAGPDVVLRVRLYGPPDAPVVVVSGGISSGRIPYAASGGWWPGIVGPGAPIDLERWRVLAFDFAPLGDVDIAITPSDQARLLAVALDDLGVEVVHAWIGASYGGMIGLGFAAHAPQRLGRLCVISAAHRPSAMGVAWRGIQRRILDLADDAGRPEEGLALARELAMTTYRSAEELEARFDRTLDDDGLSEVCRYLIARGRAYPETISPYRWRSLSASIDRHVIEPERVLAPTTLIASTTDRLTPLSDMHELAQRLPDLVRFAEIPSPFGHDAFLKDVDRLSPLLRSFLDA
jgi:homoserine O-acetyltransferase